jgi:hypothetical protein
MQGVCASSVLRDCLQTGSQPLPNGNRSFRLLTRDVVVVGVPGNLVVGDVLEDGSVANGVKDVGLLLGVEASALGVASSLDVEDSRVGPDMLVVSNEVARWIGREGRLARAGESEEERDVAVWSFVRRGVKRKVTKLDGLEVVL